MRNTLPLLALLASTLIPAPALSESFVLVHGAFQSASAWSAVEDELRAAGHEVVAVELPGRDAQGDAAKSISLQAYVDATREAVEASAEPVILVGHSFGGIIISEVAEAVPDRIGQLVYVAAYLPISGESMESLARSDGDNLFTAETFVIAPDYSHATILPGDQVRVFAQDADAEQAAALEASMLREPLGPIATPVTLSRERFGRVPLAYIRTLNDGTVSARLQTMMIERAGVRAVRDIESGHAPYVTRPSELTALIIELSVE